MRSDTSVAWWTTTTRNMEALSDAAVAANIDTARHGTTPRDRDAATQRLVLHCAAIIRNIAFRYRKQSCGVDDLMQEGAIGVLRAIKDFDPERGAKFTTYASIWILSLIRDAARNQRRIVHVPSHALERVRRISKQRFTFLAKHGRNPEADELVLGLREAGIKADETCDVDALGETLRVTSISYAWLDAPTFDSEDSLHDTLADPLQNNVSFENRRDIEVMVAGLPDRQREIISARYGIDGDEETPKEIGERLGVTRQCIEQIEDKALELLRKRATRSTTRPPPAASQTKT